MTLSRLMTSGLDSRRFPDPSHRSCPALDALPHPSRGYALCSCGRRAPSCGRHACLRLPRSTTRRRHRAPGTQEDL